MPVTLVSVPTFEELAMPLFDSLYNYARWLAREPAEAEDLVQETYLKGLRGFRSFAQGTNFKAWMFRILRNTFLTSRTGLRAVPPVSIDDEPDEVMQLAAADATPDVRLFQRTNERVLQDAIAALPLPFREVLLLSDVEELSYKEIAEMLSLPLGTVTSRLLRARKKVRDAIREAVIV
jgi:RNA polymerase sigma-70 factor (ECF subfamily)